MTSLDSRNGAEKYRGCIEYDHTVKDMCLQPISTNDNTPVPIVCSKHDSFFFSAALTAELKWVHDKVLDGSSEGSRRRGRWLQAGRHSGIQQRT